MKTGKWGFGWFHKHFRLFLITTCLSASSSPKGTLAVDSDLNHCFWLLSAPTWDSISLLGPQMGINWPYSIMQHASVDHAYMAVSANWVKTCTVASYSTVKIRYTHNKSVCWMSLCIHFPQGGLLGAVLQTNLKEEIWGQTSRTRWNTMYFSSSFISLSSITRSPKWLLHVITSICWTIISHQYSCSPLNRLYLTTQIHIHPFSERLRAEKNNLDFWNQTPSGGVLEFSVLLEVECWGLVSSQWPDDSKHK